jgi:hypothetical protein
VEVAAGGLEYTGVDMLANKPVKEFNNPLDAAEEAIKIALAWKQEQRNIYLSWGYSLDAFEGECYPLKRGIPALRKWAKEEYARLPKCDKCGELLDREEYYTDIWGEGKYCSRYCAEGPLIIR